METILFYFLQVLNKVMERRKRLGNFLSLNKASHYIPGIVQHTIDRVESLNVGQEYEFIHEMNILTFSIFTSVMFGKDANSLADRKRNYENPDGTLEELPLREFMIRLFKAYYSQLFNPITLLFRFMCDYNLCNPYIRDERNKKVFIDGMKELFRNWKDKDAISGQVFDHKVFTEEEIFFDMITFILAGAETSSHWVVSTLYFLCKYPHVMKKLKKEIADQGIDEDYVKGNKLTKDDIQSMDYLSCVVKESLRMDGPAAETFVYQAKGDIVLWGVPFEKGFFIKQDLNSGNYNPNYWYEPHNFEPDRHDFGSEYYQKAAAEGKTGTGYSRRSFGNGLRACAGQTFAILEVKIIVVVLLTLRDITCDPDLLEKEGVGFGIGSEILINMKLENLKSTEKKNLEES